MIDIISSKDMQINNIGSNLATLVYKNYDQIYQGRIEEDKRNGFGRLWTKEYQYIGSWKNDLPDGEGEYKYSGNTENISEKQIIYYKGEWKNNKMEGEGVFKWPDGRQYEGQYVDDKKEGQGTFYWPDGRKYQGAWLNGKQDGLGTYTTASGKAKQGNWKDGKRINWVQ